MIGRYISLTGVDSLHTKITLSTTTNSPVKS